MINVDIWITDRYNRWNYKIRQNLKNGERSGMINYCRQERLEMIFCVKEDFILWIVEL